MTIPIRIFPKLSIRRARLNHGKAAYLLHNLYLFGDGVPKPDFVKAQLWLDVAVKQGVVADAKIQFASLSDFNEKMAEVKIWEKTCGKVDDSMSNYDRYCQFMESEASRLLPKECVELLEHLKSTTQRQTTTPEQNITTFGKFSIPSLLTFEPSPTRQLLIEARTNFEEGLLEFWNTGRLSKNSVELLASGFLAEPLVGAMTTEMRTNIQHALLGFMKDHPNNDAAIALHGVFTMASSSEKAVMLVETAFKLQGMARYAYMLSNLCLYLQRHADAIKWCTINIKRDPKCTCEYYNRGFAYMSMQKMTLAKKDFQVYLDNSTKEARKRAATYYQLAAISMSENDSEPWRLIFIWVSKPSWIASLCTILEILEASILLGVS
ncbi:hypothetical protein BDR26DRAFT_997853 [Obelidium mucronatum]|nr:hypothetical protein BDR26DRAFT_997853 [Obelidium mucronatum]